MEITYVGLIGCPWGQKMKPTISLDKEKIKLKGEGRRIIIPLDRKQGKPWLEPCDEDGDIRTLYQLIQGKGDNVKPKNKG